MTWLSGPQFVVNSQAIVLIFAIDSSYLPIHLKLKEMPKYVEKPYDRVLEI